MTSKERAKSLVSQMTLEEKMGQMLHHADAIERLDVPSYCWWNEGLHGIARAGTATVFPQSIAMAASFDEDLIYDVACAISDEARAKFNQFREEGGGSTDIFQGLTFWSPNINIFRDPRWGRGHETYGEDPYLTARMGTCYVDGMQGNRDAVPFRKLDATLKHFAVHSGPEYCRHEFNVEIEREDMDDTYLFAFKYCIDHAKPAAIMGAYNRVNGEPCCGSPTLLECILRQEWGFDGYVVSDCGAISNFHRQHCVTATPAESAALAVNSGCDLNCGAMYNHLMKAYDLGMVTEDTITECVERLFTARFDLGMFDTCDYDNISHDKVECKEHLLLSRKMASEGIVLLENDGLLPLDASATGETKRIAVIGPNADAKDVLLGNYNGTPSHYTTFLRGIQEAFDGRVEYSRGCDIFKPSPDYCDERYYTEAIAAAKRSDVTVICVGLNSTLEGEEGDAYNSHAGGDKTDIELPRPQRELIEAIVTQTNTKTIVVNVSGSAINLGFAKEHCNAVIQCFYPGAEGGHALADILFGAVNPSGKLPLTFYHDLDGLPNFKDYTMRGRTYRYFTGTPLYPFGYGLSYTNFACVESTFSDNSASVSIQNTGSRDGATVAFVYLKSPSHPFLNKQLVGFKRVFINAGETCTVQVDLCSELLTRYPDATLWCEI